MIPLEDDPCDVIGKAMRGEGMDVSQLASAAQLEASLVQDVLDGNLNADAVKRIAAVLNLGAEALMSLPSYAPEVALPDGLHCITTPFGHAGVNAFVLVHGSSACVFDTGTDAQPISSFLSSNNLHLDTLFITHRHPDHMAGVSDLPYSRLIYPEDIQHDENYTTSCGVTLKALDVSGHLSPARAYYLDNLGCGVCIVGDSVFAGSMGGTHSHKNYLTSLETARNHLFSLPEATIICTGHGPMTSVAYEVESNPFTKRMFHRKPETP